MPAFEGGVTPEGYIQECMADLREQWRDYQDVMEDSWRMLHPIEKDRRSNVFLSGVEVRSWEDVIKADKARAVYDWPWVAGTALQYILTRSDLVLRAVTVGLEQPSDAERLKAEKLEFASRGVLNIIDQGIRDEEDGWHSLQQRVSAMLTFMAKCVVQVRLRETYPGSGEATVDCEFLDPRSFYHTTGRSLTRCYAYERFKPKAELLQYLKRQSSERKQPYTLPAKWDNYKDTDLVPVSPFWMQEPDPEKPGKLLVYETIVCGGEHEAAFEPQLRDIKTNPFVIAPVRFDPFDAAAIVRQGADGKSQQREGRALQGAPFCYRARETLNQIAGLLEYQFTGAALDAMPPQHVEVAPGTAQGEIDQPSGPGEKMVTTKGMVEYKFIQRGGQPVNVQSTLQEFKDILDGYVPWTLIRLTVNPGDPALLIDKEIDHAERALSPYVLAGGALVEGLLRKVWDEFMDSGLKFRVAGQWRSGERRGQQVLIDFKEEDMPEQSRVSVFWPPQLPRDMMRATQIATNLIQAGLYGRVDAHDKILKTENSIEVVRRADRDLRDRAQPVVDLRTLEDRDLELAEEEYKLSKLADNDPGYLAQFAKVLALRERVTALQGNLMKKPPPSPMPAAPRPSPDVQPNQDQGFASREDRRAGSQVARIGAQPNPNQEGALR